MQRQYLIVLTVDAPDELVIEPGYRTKVDIDYVVEQVVEHSTARESLESGLEAAGIVLTGFYLVAGHIPTYDHIDWIPPEVNR